MKISFKPLCETDFPLLHKWLNEPHIQTWWDSDTHWTADLIRNKYLSYVQGFKLENGLSKPISAFIIYVDEVPIGYIQIYNAYDFARTTALTGLPSPNLAAFDVFIGEKQFLNKGIGSRVIDQFLISHAATFTHVFVDPDRTNLAAIRAYQKAGFKKADIQPDTGEIWLIRTNENI